MVFFAQNKAKLCQKIDHNIGVCEKRQFFAENWEKSQKMVIITSTPGHPGLGSISKGVRISSENIGNSFECLNVSKRSEYAPDRKGEIRQK
jgi:hypothetical protein